MRETPVPIPNTMVKTHAADGTLLETARESRWLPDKESHTVTKKVMEIAFLDDCMAVRRVFLENRIQRSNNLKYSKRRS